MNKVISHVVQALDMVDERFYGLDDIAFESDELINNNAIRNLERRFMIEFSHQYAVIMDQNGTEYESVQYDFEVPKKFMWSEKPDLEIRHTFERLSERKDVDMLAYFEMQPDFVVHASQGNMDHQRLIMEAKVNPNTSKGGIYKDIFHTLIYSNKYNFHNSVLLLVNIELSRWLQQLSSYRENGFYLGHAQKLQDIYIVSKQSTQDETAVETLSKYLNS